MLTQGMFNPEIPDPRFGIKSKQGQGWKEWRWWLTHWGNIVFTPSTRWLNQAGEEIASGALDVGQVRNILNKLEEGEFLIMLPMQQSRDDMQTSWPSCTYVLAKGVLYMVCPNRLRLRSNHIHGLEFTIISPKEAKWMIAQIHKR